MDQLNINYTKAYQANSQFCQEIIHQINVLRQNPKVYLQHLEAYIDGFEDGCLNIPGTDYGIHLEEGKKVLLDARKFLKTQVGNLPPVQHNAFLEKAAIDHYVDIAPKGRVSHVSSDGKTTYRDRIEKHAAWGGSIFEAILYGRPKPTAQDVVLAWVIDDGFEKRTHRTSLLQESTKEIAIVAGPHETADFCYIAVQAAQIISKQLALVIEGKKREQQEIDYKIKFLQNKNWKQFAKEIFELQNKVRKNPKSFIPHLEQCLNRFNGKQIYTTDKKSFIETQEGQFAYVEAIEYLRQQKAQKPFAWSRELEDAAGNHVQDIGPKGLVSSIGTDGSMPTDRISRYGIIDETWAESNIFGGYNAQEVVERLLVCDGQPTRGFRKTLFNDQLLLCGISCGVHTAHGNIIQLEYVKGLLREGEAPSIKVEIAEDVSPGVMENLKKLGIDQKKVTILKDNRTAEKKIESLIGKSNVKGHQIVKQPTLGGRVSAGNKQSIKRECVGSKNPSLQISPKEGNPLANARPKSASNYGSKKPRGFFPKAIDTTPLKQSTAAAKECQRKSAIAKPPTPLKPVNSALSNLRKSVAMNPARKSPQDTMSLAVPGDKPANFTPSKTYVANSAQKRLSYENPPPKAGFIGLTPSKPRTSYNEAIKSTLNRSAIKTPNKSRGSPGALAMGHKPSNSMSMPVSYKTSPHTHSTPTDKHKQQPSQIGKGLLNPSSKQHSRQGSRQGDASPKAGQAKKPEPTLDSHAQYINDYLKNRQQNLHMPQQQQEPLMTHQTIELNEDLLKSYDEKSKQAVISEHINLVQQETLDFNDTDDHECNNFDELMDQSEKQAAAHQRMKSTPASHWDGAIYQTADCANPSINSNNQNTKQRRRRSSRMDGGKPASKKAVFEMKEAKEKENNYGHFQDKTQHLINQMEATTQDVDEKPKSREHDSQQYTQDNSDHMIQFPYSVHANGGTGKFDMESDPDRPKGAINSSVIIEEIDINGAIQRVHKKTYQLITGKTVTVTRIHNK